ncbi:MAG TPA: hypothetical protein VNU48_09485 [Burkholderiaceae bacterium]|nr:hypothetical protein [Burkholderiaceae bacterium]
MKSRLLSRLEDDIRSATQTLAADRLRCERAAYLARLGEFDEATREIAAVHQRHEARPNAAISVWLNLAHGLVSHYRELGSQAHDRVRRAHAMSVAAGLTDLQALSAAWLAHLDYLRMNATGAAGHAAEALRLARSDHHAAQARACLVVAQTYDEAGRLDRARPWYDQAHRHATAEGDDATLSAMLWNKASLRVAALRQAVASGQVGAAAEAQALLSAESTANFDAMLGVRSLRALQPILRAQTCSLLGRTDEALALYEQHLTEALDQGLRSIEGTLVADRAWCRLQARNISGASEDARLAEGCLAREAPFGDRAPGHSRLTQVWEALGDHAAAERQRQLSLHAWQGHARDQANLLEALDKALAAAPPVS